MTMFSIHFSLQMDWHEEASSNRVMEDLLIIKFGNKIEFVGI